MSKFPEKLFCNLVDPRADSGDVYTYLDLETAGEGEPPVRVGIYQLVEVVEVRVVTSVETIKVEN
jgi:hypothetical protein